MSSLRIIFFGTPNAALYALEELLCAGIVPNLVVTMPDEPKGRGLILTPPPVKILAEEKGIPVFQPERIDESAIATIAAENPDLFIVAAYGKILPKALLDISRLGAINIHPSLLPKYRGASPIRDAILSGDTETGVTLILLDEKMDHGPIIAQEKMDIRDIPPARILEENSFAREERCSRIYCPTSRKGKLRRPRKTTRARHSRVNGKRRTGLLISQTTL